MYCQIHIYQQCVIGTAMVACIASGTCYGNYIAVFLHCIYCAHDCAQDPSNSQLLRQLYWNGGKIPILAPIFWVVKQLFWVILRFQSFSSHQNKLHGSKPFLKLYSHNIHCSLLCFDANHQHPLLTGIVSGQSWCFPAELGQIYFIKAFQVRSVPFLYCCSPLFCS